MGSVFSEELSALLKENGTNIVGFADLRSLPPESRNDLPYGITIAVALNPGIISEIKDGPNSEYFLEYKRVNSLLDSLGGIAEGFLKERGYIVKYASATNTGINWETLSTILPHKTVATRAGLGWIGKCALLVTKEYGSAVRITSVLTDAVLPAGEAVDESRCGYCSICVDACPGQAITGTEWHAGLPRDAIYDPFDCRKTAREWKRTRKGINDNICGICIAVCPWTERYINSSV